MSQDFINALVEVVKSKVTAANEIAEKVGASSSNVAKSIKEWRETSEDPRAAEWRERNEKMQAVILKEREAIDAVAREALNVKVLGDDEAATLKEQHKERAKEAREALKTLTDTAAMLGLEIGEVPELLTFRGKAAGSGAGTGAGGRRLRFASVTINGTEVGTLSKAGLKIKTDTGKDVRAKDLQSALFAEAGTEDMSKINDVTFLYSETDDKGETHSYEIVAVREDATGEVTSDATEEDATESE